MSVREFERLGPDHHLQIPNSVVEMLSGSLGEPEGGWPRAVRRVILRGAKPRRGRPGARLEPVDFQATAAAVRTKIGHESSPDEVLSYLMYPEVFTKFARARQAWGDMGILPTPQFFYGIEKGEEITVDLEPGKTLVVKFLTIGEPHPEGYRTVFFELNGQPREVDIRDRARQVTALAKPKADPVNPGHVGAPIPGIVTTIAVELHEEVQKGDRLLVMEAMKMQTTVYAPIAGKVVQRLIHAGDHVEAKDLLLVIESP
jgi:pyruvate carboxylase